MRTKNTNGSKRYCRVERGNLLGMKQSADGSGLKSSTLTLKEMLNTNFIASPEPSLKTDRTTSGEGSAESKEPPRHKKQKKGISLNRFLHNSQTKAGEGTSSKSTVNDNIQEVARTAYTRMETSNNESQDVFQVLQQSARNPLATDTNDDLRTHTVMYVSQRLAGSNAETDQPKK